MKGEKKLRKRGEFVKKRKSVKRIRKMVVEKRINTKKGTRLRKSDGFGKRKKNASLGDMRRRRREGSGRRRKEKRNGAKLRRRGLLARNERRKRRKNVSRKCRMM